MNRTARVVLIGSVACLLAACTRAPSYTTQLAAAQKIPFPQASYAGEAWGSGSWIIASIGETTSDVDRLWRFHPDGTDKQQLNLTDNLSCVRRDYLYPASLAGGQVGYVLTCLVNGMVGPEEYMFAYDPATGLDRQLMADPLKSAQGQLTWNPSLTRGIFSTEGDPCTNIAWLSTAGPSPFAPVSIGGWQLKNDWKNDNGCPDQGETAAPDWSPDGNTIAFFASSRGSGSGGPNMDDPLDLYLMNATTLHPKAVLADVLYPRTLKWSPDGRWLAFDGSIGSAEGAWLFRPSDSKLIRISDQPLSDLGWSPDGKQLVARRWPDNADLMDLYLLDVASITG